MTEITFGKLLDEYASRDAIHFALAPVTADQDLFPGQRIGFVDGSKELVCASLDTVESVRCLGIVDPFLKTSVKKKQRFWMFLLPNTVTGMRHQWEHPAFDNSVPARNEKREFSIWWLRNYARTIRPFDDPEAAYQTLLEDIGNDAIVGYGRDLYCLSDLPNADELKEHVEVVLGKRIDLENFTFHCSC